MTFLDRTRGTNDPRPVWFLVERERHNSMAFTRDSRARALADFADTLTEAAESGEGYSPWESGRALQVVGPDVHERTGDDDALLDIPPRDDRDDPILRGDVALRAVLGDDYDLLVHGPRVAAVLES